MTLLGVGAQLASIRAALGRGRMHHAWLLHGPRGVGKASFAKLVGARILAESSHDAPHGHDFELPSEYPTARLIAAHSHPDHVLVEREAWDKDRVIAYDRRKPDDAIARNIRIAQIRALVPILSMAPSVASRRVVIIDAADDLEPAAANALLKNLEEPPASTTFFLVSHAPGRLLPTIRSRCRAMAFPRLDDAAVEQILGTRGIAPAARERIVSLAAGSAGAALAFVDDDVLALEGALDELATTGDPNNAQRLDLAARLGVKSAAGRYQSFLRRAPTYIASRAEQLRGAPLAAAVGQWERARQLAHVAVAQSLPAESVVFEMAGYVAALAAGNTAAKG